MLEIREQIYHVMLTDSAGSSVNYDRFWAFSQFWLGHVMVVYEKYIWKHT